MGDNCHHTIITKNKKQTRASMRLQLYSCSIHISFNYIIGSLEWEKLYLSFILQNVSRMWLYGVDRLLATMSILCKLCGDEYPCVCTFPFVGDVVETTTACATELPRQNWVPPQEVPLWDISNCILEDGQILISPEEEVPIRTCTPLTNSPWLKDYYTYRHNANMKNLNQLYFH